MTGRAITAPMGTFGTLAGCVAQPYPAAKMASADAPEVLLLIMEGTRKFSVFVEPNSLSPETASKLAIEKAGSYCRRTFGAMPRLAQLKRQSFGVPDAWQIDGTCE